jgi:hypothetical protein
MLLPFTAGKVPAFTFLFKADESANIDVRFCVSQRLGNYTPDSCLAQKEYQLPFGVSEVTIDFDLLLKEYRYGFILIGQNDKVSVAQSDVRVTGILAVFNRRTQKQNDMLGVEEISFYPPERRPGGKNFALKVEPALKTFDAEQLKTFVFRPDGTSANAWVAALTDKNPSLKMEWDKPQLISSAILWFDTDFDHAMESCLMGHPENTMPFCVQEFKILDDRGQVVYETTENHHSRHEIKFEKPVQTSALAVQLYRKHENVPVSLFGIQAFGAST